MAATLRKTAVKLGYTLVKADTRSCFLTGNSVQLNGTPVLYRHLYLAELQDGYHLGCFLDFERLSEGCDIPHARGIFPHFLQEVSIPNDTTVFKAVVRALEAVNEGQLQDFQQENLQFCESFYEAFGFEKWQKEDTVWWQISAHPLALKLRGSRLITGAQKGMMISFATCGQKGEESSRLHMMLRKLQQHEEKAVSSWAQTVMSVLGLKLLETTKESATQTAPKPNSPSTKEECANTPPTDHTDSVIIGICKIPEGEKATTTVGESCAYSLALNTPLSPSELTRPLSMPGSTTAMSPSSCPSDAIVKQSQDC